MAGQVRAITRQSYPWCISDDTLSRQPQPHHQPPLACGCLCICFYFCISSCGDSRDSDLAIWPCRLPYAACRLLDIRLMVLVVEGVVVSSVACLSLYNTGPAWPATSTIRTDSQHPYPYPAFPQLGTDRESNNSITFRLLPKRRALHTSSSHPPSTVPCPVVRCKAPYPYWPCCRQPSDREWYVARPLGIPASVVLVLLRLYP